MKGLLVRVGVDQAYGDWNAPIDADNHFVYVPIPEKLGTPFHPGLERRYGELMPALYRFCDKHECDLADVKFPELLLRAAMHLDPDFECLTYGDKGNARGAALKRLTAGDFIVFYSGMRPVHKCEHKLVYALIGIFVINEVVGIGGIPKNRWYENAHLRKSKRGELDVVVRAKKEESGRFERCIPIGEWRDRAYRVQRKLLTAWGDLSVQDGYIQRSAVPPSFNHPQRFLKWLRSKKAKLVQRNN